MKIKKCYLLLCVAWTASFICLMYHAFTKDGLEVITTLTADNLLLIVATMGCSCCNSSCCKKED